MNLSNERSNKGDQNSNSWDLAIQDAEQEIVSLTRQRDRLRRAIRVFKANKLEGMKWPGRRIIRHGG